MRSYNYERVRQAMLLYPHEYLSKKRIAEITGLDKEQVSIVIRAAWRLGWVSRIEQTLNANAFGEGKYPTKRTQYKIKRTESWMGIIPLYLRTLKNGKGN